MTHVGLGWKDYSDKGAEFSGDIKFILLLMIIPSCHAPKSSQNAPVCHVREAQNGILTHFPSFLSLSSSGWNMKPGPFQPSLSPGLPVPPAPTLICITQLHLAFSDLNQFWHFDRKLLSSFFFSSSSSYEPPIFIILSISHSDPGLDFFNGCFLNVFSPCKLHVDPELSETFIFVILVERKHPPGWHWDAGDHDCKLSSK